MLVREERASMQRNHHRPCSRGMRDARCRGSRSPSSVLLVRARLLLPCRSETLERCRSGLNSGGRSSAAVAPGCFSVYVGPERERFVVCADCTNHPLFRCLLDDAE
ncbi:hypothetical protein D1007_20126 [Hordeum vulgare]|uniref:Uncharacterized protein n=1 Tax=Hordeum vulgare subsp. vulgare TaxID=112509 RepID=A0A8I6Y6Y9_HORVV|nr:hypothetical protein D1007_20126 [Hordeum vulgare]KAI4988019.1 hypothetical protein ZWY2020_029649 [Hordeum vulgare]